MSGPPALETTDAPAAHPIHESRSLTRAETEEFAGVLGIPPERLRPFRHHADLADDADSPSTYEQLVKDPIKSFLSRRPGYYQRVKVDLLLSLVSRHFPDVPRRSLRVLDIGCGTGDLMRGLEEHFDDVCGCDRSLSMVARAGAKALWMPSPTRVPYADRSFDIALCACVYHHVDARLRLKHVCETRRALRRGGLFLMFEHNPRNPLTRFIVRRCPLDAGAELLGARTARKLLRAAGYRDVRTRYYLHFPERIYRRLGRLERFLSVTGLGGQFCTIGRNP